MIWQPQEFSAHLLAWFERDGRHHLPWQIDRSPYRVWVSEVMLQQTQVATVIPYYERFMVRFPDIASLSSAPLDEVLHLWTGLGYYARARNLHACAQAVMADCGGALPRDLDGLTALPGIGRSTGGAILALSCDQRHPILDGNVKRVLARVFGIDGDPGSSAVLNALWARSEECTPSVEVRAYTQGIMDLGATVCTRARPACTVCPLNTGCTAAQSGRQMQLPGKKTQRSRPSREATLLIAQMGDEDSVAVLVERRPPSGLWGGLWSPPQFATEREALEWCRRVVGGTTEAQALPAIDHAFTHFDLRLKPIQVRCVRQDHVGEGDRLWYRLQTPPRVGLPQPIVELFQRLRDGQSLA
jgi:A/G-specific adenine glycosylase